MKLLEFLVHFFTNVGSCIVNGKNMNIYKYGEWNELNNNKLFYN